MIDSVTSIAGKYSFRFLNARPDLPINFRTGHFTLHGFCDTSWAGGSITSYIFMLAGKPTSFGANPQQLTAMSSTGAELVALAQAAREGIYLSNLLCELKLGQFYSLQISGDRTGGLFIAANSF